MPAEASQPLRVPVRIMDSYVRPGEEARYFPNHHNYLTRDEIYEIFPAGLITYERFTHEGVAWKLHKRPAANGAGTLWIAVLDESNPGYMRSPSPTPRGPVSHDISSDIRTSLSDVAPPVSQSIVLANTRPTQLSLPSIQYPPSPTHHLRERNRFTEDLLAATDSPIPLDRYKALNRLMSVLKRHQAALDIRRPERPESWSSPEAQDLLKHIVMVGECLAKFGTADFREGSNSSRAITTKDYASLLQRYLQAHGCVFTDDFLDGVPSQALQDEALTVRSLLQTRCEANQLLFAQLVKSVGMEGQHGATVFNNSVVTANPTNRMTSNPKNMVQAASNAWAKASHKSRMQLGAACVATAVGLWLLKGRIFGGARRRRGARRSEDWSDDWADTGRSRRSSRGPLDLGADPTSNASTERLAVRYLAACHEELRKSQHNEELLRNDWRLGNLRLASPAQPLPPGYAPVDTSFCSLNNFLVDVEVGPPTRNMMAGYRMLDAPALTAGPAQVAASTSSRLA